MLHTSQTVMWSGLPQSPEVMPNQSYYQQPHPHPPPAMTHHPALVPSPIVSTGPSSHPSFQFNPAPHQVSLEN